MVATPLSAARRAWPSRRRRSWCCSSSRSPRSPTWTSRCRRAACCARPRETTGMATEFNVDQWPVCFLRMEGEQTEDEFEGYIGAFNRFYERRELFSIVTQLKSYRSNPRIVARTGRWFKDTEPLIRKYWLSN